MSFTTSGGPGGQHANKTATRVELRWNVLTSRALGPRQRERLRQRLDNRLDGAGVLRVASDAQRSQLRNREAARERLAKIVAGGLKTPRARISTAPTAGSKERRLADKRRRSELKRGRTDPSRDVSQR